MIGGMRTSPSKHLFNIYCVHGMHMKMNKNGNSIPETSLVWKVSLKYYQ